MSSFMRAMYLAPRRRASSTASFAAWAKADVGKDSQDLHLREILPHVIAGSVRRAVVDKNQAKILVIGQLLRVWKHRSRNLLPL